MPELVNQFGRPIKKAELTREFAAPQIAGIRTVWTDSIASGLTPEKLVAVLRNAVDGDAREYLTLAEEIEEREDLAAVRKADWVGRRLGDQARTRVGATLD